MFKISKMLIASLVLVALPLVAVAQGRVAVVNLEEAILQTDAALKGLADLRKSPDYVADKTELDRLQAEREALIKEVQKEMAVMSAEQQQAARKRMAAKNADLEHVLGKLQKVEQDMGQRLLSEMTPKVQAVLRELIQSEGIGLLLQQGAVIHADNGYSITAKVTDKLNQLTAAGN